MVALNCRMKPKEQPVRPWVILSITAIVGVNALEWGRIYKIGPLGFAFLGLMIIGLLSMALSKK